MLHLYYFTHAFQDPLFLKPVFTYSLLIFSLLLNIEGFSQLNGIQRPAYPTQVTLSTTQSYTSSGYYQPQPNHIGQGDRMVLQKQQQALAKHNYPKIVTPEMIEKQYGSYANYVKAQKFANMNPRQKYLYQVHALLKEESIERRKEPEKSPYRGVFQFADHSTEGYKSSRSYYQKAYDELSKMLEGEDELNLKRAVYGMENAVLRDRFSYSEYEKLLNSFIAQIKSFAKKQKLDLTDNVSVNYAIQRLFSDTTINYQTGEPWQPLKYDFDDIYGDSDPSKSFVTKLISEGTGQCRSMPLLYMILAQELKAEAYISYSPKHSYVQFKDESSGYYNFETTNGSLTSDQWINGNGFVKVEALKSGIYGDTVNYKQLVAQLLTELATTYRLEHGYDEFYEDCLRTSVKHYPHNIHNYLEQSNMATAKFDKSMYEVGYPNLEQMESYPEQKFYFEQMVKLYDLIDNLGFSEMPREAYEGWLKSLEEEKQKQMNEELQKVILIKRTD